MQAVVLNGARQGEAHIDAISDQVRAELDGAGWAVRAFTLREIAIAPCAGCFGCWVKTPGECVMPDDNRTITAATIASDLTVLLTPVVFGGYSAELKKVVDHQITLVSPFFTRVAGEVHHQRRYARYPNLLVIGVQRGRNDAAATLFAQQVARHARNFHAPRHRGEVWQADTATADIDARVRGVLKTFQEVAA